jgi:archaellum component FlaC
LTELFSGKYLKKLIGRTEIEDALKRLDKLTQEEARMATAQVLKVTHTVDDRVREVTDKVIDVDDRVAGVDDRVAGVDNRVAGVDDRVAGVDDRVKAVDEKVATVIDGAQYIYNQPFQSNDFNLSGWKRGEASRRPSETFVISKPLSC